MASPLDRLKEWWETADKGRRTGVIAGAALLAIGVVATGYFASKPQMIEVDVLARNADLGKVETSLSKEGIRYRLTGNGRLFVESDKRALAVAALQREGIAAQAREVDLSPFGEIPNLVSSEKERSMLEALEQSKISRDLESMDPIAQARVGIDFGKTSPFAGGQQAATASVIVTLSPGALAGPNLGRTIAQTVAGRVAGLELTNVTVATSQGDDLWNPTGSSATEGIARLQAEQHLSEKLRRELQGMLDEAFGPDTTIVRLHAFLDLDQVTERFSNTTPTKDAERETVEREDFNGANSGTGAVPGTASNVEALSAAGTAGGNDSDSYTREREERSYGTNLEERAVERAQGAVTGLNVTVMIDRDSPALDAQTQAAIEDVVRGFVGLAPGETSETHVATVVPVTFNQTIRQERAAAVAEAAKAEKNQQMVAMMPIAALLIVGLMLATAIGKAAKKAGAPTPQPALAAANGTTLIDTPQAVATAAADAEFDAETAEPGDSDLATLPEGDESGEPMTDLEMFGEELPDDWSDRSEEEKEVARAVFTTTRRAPTEIDEIEEKVDVPLERIRHLAMKRPESIALLLKGWMAQEHR